MLNRWKVVAALAAVAAVAMVPALAQVPAAGEQVWEFDWNAWLKCEQPPAGGDVYAFTGRQGEWIDMLVTVGGWDAKLSVLDAQGKLLGEKSSSGRPEVELELPADGEYYLRVHSAGEYILMPALQRVFDTTGRSRDLMFASAEFGPYDRLYNRTYQRADGTQLRWKWGEFNKSIVEEQLRDGQVVETHTITRGEEGHLLMDGKVDGVLSRRDGVVVGDHVDWGGSYGISVRAADSKLRRETMGATEYLQPVEE
jgi:hypothetical protein